VGIENRVNFKDAGLDENGRDWRVETCRGGWSKSKFLRLESHSQKEGSRS